MTLHFDFFFTNMLPHLTSIDESIRYRGLVNLRDRTPEEIYEALDSILRLYNKAGYRIKCLHCDPEFIPLMDPVLDDMGRIMNCTPAGAHCPEAECSNRVIGERVRAIFHALPCKAIPKS